MNQEVSINAIAKMIENPLVQYELGKLYQSGNGIDKDSKKATEWYKKAAEQGNADAQNDLAKCYYYGEGVEKNLLEAAVWYRKSAEQGNAKAQNYLGECYYYGEGVKKNLYEAIVWYKKSANQGNAEAQYSLGHCYEHGAGVRRDLQEAISWYNKSATQGNENAQQALSKINIVTKNSEKEQNANGNTNENTSIESFGTEIKVERLQTIREFEYYQCFDIKTCQGQDECEIIRSIIQLEQPIHIDKLCERIKPIYERKNATSFISKKVNAAIKRLKGEVVKLRGNFLMINGCGIKVRKYNPHNGYRRDINYIHNQELELAAKEIKNRNLDISREELLTRTARIFGFERSGKTIKSKLKTIINRVFRETR